MNAITCQTESLRPVVSQIARAMAARYPLVDYDDLYADGLYGAWEAVRSYDAARGASLRTHAAARIRGAMLDGIRDRDPLTRHQRAAGDIRVCNLYADFDVADRHDHASDVLARIAFDEIAELVPPADRELIVAYYRDDQTKKQIGQGCGFTESWACLTFREIINNLRAALLANGTAA